MEATSSMSRTKQRELKSQELFELFAELFYVCRHKTSIKTLSLLANASIDGCSLYQTPLCEGRPAPSLPRPLWIEGALPAIFQSECTFLSSGGDRQARLPSLPALVLRRPKRDHSSVRGARPPGGP